MKSYLARRELTGFKRFMVVRVGDLLLCFVYFMLEIKVQGMSLIPI
jgi:hypothetical protein